ncbi:hypothetical protein Tco_1465382 [Tanacetum coccineum]
MPLDCQLGIVAMWGKWEGFVKWLMECCRVEVWSKTRCWLVLVLAGDWEKGLYKLGCDRERLKMIKGKRLKGRDWNDKDIKRSTEMLDKIDQLMKHREQLRRLEECVGGRPKTIDPHSFVRPIGEGDVSKPRSFERHMSKSTKPYPNFYNNDFYYLVNLSTGEKYTTSLTKHFTVRYHIQGIEDMVPERWSKKIHRYQIEALNGIHRWEDGRQDFFKAEINNRRPDKDYYDKIIISVLGVEIYQRTLNLTKPKLYFEGINEKISYTIYGTEKGIVYLNQHNVKSLMKLSGVHKFCNVVSWKATLQPSVALSTAEAKYMALIESAKEGIWLKGLIEDLGFPQD